MANKLDQIEMVNLVWLVSLSLCFGPNEEYLSEEQIIARRLTPSEEYTRMCLSNLVLRQAVQYRYVTDFSHVRTELRYIKNPAKESGSHHAFICACFGKLVDILDTDFGNHLFLLSLRINIIAYECIEYTEFYAKKSGMHVVNYSPAHPKLTLMLMELTQGEVYALIWRAIKVREKHHDRNSPPLNFDEIMDSAFVKYIGARRVGTQLDEYKAPSQLKPSIISGIIDKCLRDLPVRARSGREP